MSALRVNAKMQRRKIVHHSSALRVIAEQSTLSLLSRDGLLRGACHRARRRRDPVTRYDDPDTAGCLKFKSELCACRSGRALITSLGGFEVHPAWLASSGLAGLPSRSCEAA
jgi:hypothetical protein